MSRTFGAVMPAHPILVSKRLTVPQREPFVDPDTAAAFVGITRRTLLQKVRTGKIPGYPLDRGAKKKEWRFKLSELDRYLCSAINSVLQPPEPANRRI
jgi:excisionase family DNA binding protein